MEVSKGFFIISGVMQSYHVIQNYSLSNHVLQHACGVFCWYGFNCSDMLCNIYFKYLVKNFKSFILKYVKFHYHWTP
jgi:hypothetical protein